MFQGRAQISASCRRAVPVIHVQGSHYEVGFDVGRTFSALIKDFISSYENLRTFEKEYKSEAGREAYDKTLANMRRRYPYYVKEMQGIADGAGVPFQQLFLLQLDDIIGTINENSVSRNDTGGCSSIAFHSNKHTYLGHTEDAFSETLNHFYIMSAHIIPTPEDKEAGGVDEDDELSLDEAMQRAVWGAPSAPPAAAPPDSAPPPPLPPLPSPAGGGGGGGGGGGSGLDERSAGGRKLSLQEVRAPPAYEDATRGGAGGGAGGAGGATVNVGRRAGGDRVQSLLPEDAYQALYDRQPHSVFVQLDELLGGDSHEATWQQRARWIKYEQDVEEGAARWGRPHVASLSFHSLLNLRRCLEQGVVLLDLQQEELGGAAQAVVAAMADARLIAADDAPLVLRSLLLRHRHVHDDRSFRFSISGRKHSSYTSLQSKLDGQRRRSSHALPPERKKSLAGLMTGERKKSLVGLVEAERKKSAAGSLSAASHDELKRAFADPVLRRIPEDAEATTVLVGAVNFLEQPTIAFVRLARGILMPDVTEVPVPVRFMFVLLGPEDADLDYREVGRSISTLMSDPTFHALAYRADDRGELLSGINEFLDDSIVLPPGDWERPALLPVEELRAKSEHIRRRKLAALERRASLASPASLPADKQALLDAEAAMPTWPPPPPADPLAKTGRLFGGVVRDMRRRYPLYVSDFTDALSGQCAAAAIFMYFAALSSAITFGGLYAEKTRGLIGISETLVFTMGGGVVFALAAGQPLMITGATGPLLLLDDSLAAFCRARDLDLLAVRAAAAVWMLLFALLVAAAEGSRAVKLITRFTEDIFAFLISLIFISEPITNLVSVYRTHPLGVEYAQAGGNATSSNPDPAPPQPNTALFCTMLTLGTFIIAYYLRIFRNSKFLGRSARRALGDFGVPLAIVAMVGVSAAVPAWTERLRVPAGLRPTAARGWLDPLRAVVRLPAWLLAGAALPALMVYIIVFMETHIAELIVAKPERGLRKGSGLHLDIVVMSLVNVASGACGAPWLCVATVRSVSHVAALTLMSTNHAPGEKPYIVDVKEQRVTGLVVSVLVGLSVLAARFLRLVPMAVLFGVFLYMGISSLAGIQFWERCVLLLKPVKHHPQVAYVRRVPTLRMHLFTLVQAAGLALLYAVKSSRASLALPFFLLLMIPLRMSLARVFTPLQLRALDGRQPDLDCKDDEPDFYEEARLP